MIKPNKHKIAIVNHGCPKNLVDTEWMLGLLKNAGYEITIDEENCDIAVVNTCAFIHDAEKESIQSILRLANMNKKVIVAGCLAQKYNDELKQAIPEISGVVGISDISKIVEAVKTLSNTQTNNFYNEVTTTPHYKFPQNVERQLITIGASSYLKISEGCNCECGYCIIPKLRGKQVSRPIEDIIEEAEFLASRGIVEIILIAQDTTAYGTDLYGELKLPQLLKELNKIEGIEWIRIMYAYPSHVTNELLKAIKDTPKVVKYLDLPLQHYNLDVLRSMKRPAFDYDGLIKKIRTAVPEIAIRSTMIVGYPGETDEQFEDLEKFIERTKFDKLGVFEYCREKGTYSYSLKNQILKSTKKKRFNRLMKLQNKISKEKNLSRIGDTIKCIIDAITDDGLLVMRSQFDAPEIDGLVYAKQNKACLPGDIVCVKIVSADDYDLFGELVGN